MAGQRNAPVDPLVEQGLADYEEAWVPKNEGESIVGYFVRLTSGPTPYGTKPIVVLDVDGTHRSVWLLGEVLHNQFVRARPIVGEKVAVVYRGKRKAKNPTPGRSDVYHDFRVVVDRGEAGGNDLSWEQLAPEPEPEAADTAGGPGELPEGL